MVAAEFERFIEADLGSCRRAFAEEVLLSAYFAPESVVRALEVFIGVGCSFGRDVGLGVACDFYLAGAEYNDREPNP